MPTDPETIYAEILRLYRELQALPRGTNGEQARRSPTYLAIEAEIRTLSVEYSRLMDEPATTLDGRAVTSHSTADP